MEPRYPRILPDRDKWRKYYLDEDVTVILSGRQIEVIEKGFRFDGQTIWFPFSLFIKSGGNDIYAALVHDYLIARSPWTRYNRKFQDNEYRYFMNKPEYFESKFRRFLFPKIVRIYGFLAYDLWGDNRGDVL